MHKETSSDKYYRGVNSAGYSTFQFKALQLPLGKAEKCCVLSRSSEGKVAVSFVGCQQFKPIFFLQFYSCGCLLDLFALCSTPFPLSLRQICLQVTSSFSKYPRVTAAKSGAI